MSWDYEGSESQPVWVNAVCDGLMGSPGGRGERELVQLCANSLRSRSGDHLYSRLCTHISVRAGKPAASCELMFGYNVDELDMNTQR